MNFLAGLLRWTIESKWESNDINVSIITAGGDSATVDVSNITNIKLEGEVFDKLMYLRQFADYNSIVMDSTIVDNLQQAKIGVEFAEIADGIYQYRC